MKLYIDPGKAELIPGIVHRRQCDWILFVLQQETKCASSSSTATRWNRNCEMLLLFSPSIYRCRQRGQSELASSVCPNSMARQILGKSNGDDGALGLWMVKETERGDSWVDTISTRLCIGRHYDVSLSLCLHPSHMQVQGVGYRGSTLHRTRGTLHSCTSDCLYQSVSQAALSLF